MYTETEIKWLVWKCVSYKNLQSSPLSLETQPANFQIPIWIEIIFVGNKHKKMKNYEEKKTTLN